MEDTTKKCPFCQQVLKKIIKGKYAFSAFDQFPVSKGHCLIIPNRHVNNIFELADCELMDLYAVLNDTKNYIDSLYSPDGYNIGINMGEAAGQTVPHLHIHLIPRYNGDVKNPRGGVRGVIPNKQSY